MNQIAQDFVKEYLMLDEKVKKETLTQKHNPEKSNFCGHLGWALFFFFSGLINANAIFQWSTGDGR